MENQETLMEEPPAPKVVEVDDGVGVSYDENGEPEATESASLPDWAVMPSGLVVPPDRTVYFVRFKAEWTLARSKGDRVLVLWPITVREEKIGYGRARGDTSQVMDMLSQMAIRAIDGVPVKADVHAHTCAKLYDELGLKCVAQLRNWYARQHGLGQEALLDFYGSCIAVVSSVAV